MIEIKQSQEVDFKGYTLIEGFPGAGLVGPMAISYIIDKLNMKFVGRIESPDFPPLIAIHGDRPMPPIRLYYNERNKILTILAEFAIPLELTYDLSKTIYKFAKAKGITKIVSIGGIPATQQQQPQGSEPNNSVFAIASNDDMLHDAQKAGLRSVGEGVATGVSAMIMLEAVSDGLPDISILVQVDPNILDPKYAELAILSLNKLIKLDVDVTELDKEAKDVEAKIRELLKKNRVIQEAHKKATDLPEGPPMYA